MMRKSVLTGLALCFFAAGATAGNSAECQYTADAMILKGLRAGNLGLPREVLDQVQRDVYLNCLYTPREQPKKAPGGQGRR